MIENDWAEKLQGEYKKPYYRKLYNTVVKEYKEQQVFPKSGDSQAEGCYSWAGSLSQCRTGAGVVLFRTERDCSSPFLTKYFQRAAG